MAQNLLRLSCKDLIVYSGNDEIAIASKCLLVTQNKELVDKDKERLWYVASNDVGYNVFQDNFFNENLRISFTDCKNSKKYSGKVSIFSNTFAGEGELFEEKLINLN